MKKYFALFLSIIMVLVAFLACTPAETPDNTTAHQDYFTTTVPTETASSTNSAVASRIGIPELGMSDSLEYTGELIELTLDVQVPEWRKISMVFFVDGFLQPYSIDGGEVDNFHIVPAGTYKISFHPVCGKAGETLQFISRIILQPDFDEVDNMDYFDYLELVNDQRGLTNAEVNLVMKADSPSSPPELARDLTYVEDIEDIFRLMSSVGETTSDMRQTDFRIYDDVVEVKENEVIEDEDYGRQNDIIAKKNTEHEIFICGYGKTAKYRVSLFINNELQYAFDGKAYLDMEIVENKQTTCSVKINTEGLDKYNYIYLLYCPIDLDLKEIEYRADKTHSSMFIVE